MTTAFLSKGIWPQLTKAVRASPHRCEVAVAYFSAGASRLLPLAEGSRLVVDASERAVASGQTCPADLLKLVKDDVAVFSVSNLHAKVFLIGRSAYIGSANVSGRSASLLLEAVVRTNEHSAVRAARSFVRKCCVRQLTPKVLERLGSYTVRRTSPAARGTNDEKTQQRPSARPCPVFSLHNSSLKTGQSETRVCTTRGWLSQRTKGASA